MKYWVYHEDSNAKDGYIPNLVRSIASPQEFESAEKAAEHTAMCGPFHDGEHVRRVWVFPVDAVEQFQVRKKNIYEATPIPRDIPA